MWQRRHGRHDLPWQNTTDPYRVWLSEVMLQQTQVATVLGYYEPFLLRFPDVAALAAAPLDDVLARWSGLGYYSRARHLHRCAQVVVNDWGGEFPRRSQDLERLPGVGRSTAAAIAVFCFGERAAILDGNVKRVLARYVAFDADLSVAAHLNALWDTADSLLPARAVESYTQGLMDLGATVCVRRAPHCTRCPVQSDCAAHRSGRFDELPVKSRRLKRGRRASALLWLVQGDRVWLERRPSDGVWGGLWSFPERPSLAHWQDVVSTWPGHGEALAPIDHVLTHVDWRLQPLRWELPRRLAAEQRQGVERQLGAGQWVACDDALALGLAAPIRTLLADR